MLYDTFWKRIGRLSVVDSSRVRFLSLVVKRIKCIMQSINTYSSCFTGGCHAAWNLSKIRLTSPTTSPRVPENTVHSILRDTRWGAGMKGVYCQPEAAARLGTTIRVQKKTLKVTLVSPRPPTGQSIKGC